MVQQPERLAEDSPAGSERVHHGTLMAMDGWGVPNAEVEVEATDDAATTAAGAGAVHGATRKVALVVGKRNILLAVAQHSAEEAVAGGARTVHAAAADHVADSALVGLATKEIGAADRGATGGGHRGAMAWEDVAMGCDEAGPRVEVTIAGAQGVEVTA